MDARSKTVTVCPYFLLSSSAAARPAGPEPITATVLPERIFGGCGLTQPFFQAVSIILSASRGEEAEQSGVSHVYEPSGGQAKAAKLWGERFFWVQAQSEPHIPCS